MNETKAVLNHLKNGKHITSMQAFKTYGVTRLSGIIYYLKKQGYNIKSISKTVKTRYGATTVVSEYYLASEEHCNEV